MLHDCDTAGRKTDVCCTGDWRSGRQQTRCHQAPQPVNVIAVMPPCHEVSAATLSGTAGQSTGDEVAREHHASAGTNVQAMRVGLVSLYEVFFRRSNCDSIVTQGLSTPPRTPAAVLILQQAAHSWG